jgi:hypothetical protein
MRAKDFMMREEITITADRTVDESIIPFVEHHTGQVPVAGDPSHWVDPVKDLDIGTRQPWSWPVGQRDMDRTLTPPGGMRAGEER